MNQQEKSSAQDNARAGHDEFRAAYGAWITTNEDLERLAVEWQQLSQEVAGESDVLSFASISERWGQQTGAQLAIIAVRNSAGRLVGLAPFYVALSMPDGVRRLSFLGEAGAHQLKILVDARFEDPVIQEVARMLAYHRHEWDCIDLSLPGLMPLLDYVNAMTSPAKVPVPVVR
jgi:hypothetical protein